uniref:Protein FAR-RED IMPAIRED RESPONSE 1-like n=2 Tax=Nicotiana TaxID=4085 RepID=A0A1S4C2W1_TOBAC
MKEGEAGALLEYFEKRIEDPSFFFPVQLDVDDMITNIFWTNSKMIMDYKISEDMLSFDISYQTNKEYGPLASFVGWNNHRKMFIIKFTFKHTLRVEEELNKLKTLETAVGATTETICYSLLGLEELYKYIDDLNLPITFQALSPCKHEKLVEDLLDKSVRPLDVCGTTKELVSQCKEN